MLLNKLLKLILLFLGCVFIVFQGMSLDVYGSALSAVIFILLIWLYIGWTKRISKLFLLFLVCFALAQLLAFIGWFTPLIKDDEIDYMYYISNILYIFSYTFLIIKMFRQLNFKKVFSELLGPVFVLVILDVFCVILISETIESSFTTSEYILEFSYNAIIMLLLSFALLNYMYRNNNKSMLFLIGSIFIVFSEIIQLAYFYILEIGSLGYSYSFFLVVAFIFYYMQSQIPVSKPVSTYVDELFESSEIEKTKH